LSITPNDGDTDVAVGSDIVLTFNNKIVAEAITLLNANTGDMVAVTKAWDAFGKVLTMKSSTALTTNTMYIVSIAGVKDIYGQSLMATSKAFTTVT